MLQLEEKDVIYLVINYDIPFWSQMQVKIRPKKGRITRGEEGKGTALNSFNQETVIPHILK